jgi:hypothetical protein
METELTLDEVLAHFGTRYRVSMVLGMRPHSAYRWTAVPKHRQAQLREIMRQTQPQPAGGTSGASQG